MDLARINREAVHLWHKLTGEKARARKAAFASFDAAVAALRPGDLAIDLGANAGLFTEPMAQTGAAVVAFEPDPHAFGLLQKRLGARANVTLIAAAAGAEAGQFHLYRHRDFQVEPDRRTTSSSLIAGKRNVDAAHAIAVEVKDFVAYLTDLNRDVALLKIDIEGAEVALLERLLADPVANRIRKIFVETHERMLPDLALRTQTLKAMAKGRATPVINWDWH